MNNILKENQPLSYYLVNAIDRLKEHSFSKTDSSIRHTLNIWKNIAINQEQQIEELVALRKSTEGIIDSFGTTYPKWDEMYELKNGRIKELKELLKELTDLAKRNNFSVPYYFNKALNKD